MNKLIRIDGICTLVNGDKLNNHCTIPKIIWAIDGIGHFVLNI